MPKAFLGAQERVVGSSRFYVEVQGVVNAVFTELSGLQIETEVKEYVEGGQNGHVHRLPGRTKVGNLTFKRGLGDQKLLEWYLKIVSGKIDKRHVTIKLYDVDNSLVFKLDFKDAYPVKWVGPQLSAAGNNVAIDTLEIAHGGLV